MNGVEFSLFRISPQQVSHEGDNKKNDENNSAACKHAPKIFNNSATLLFFLRIII